MHQGSVYFMMKYVLIRGEQLMRLYLFFLLIDLLTLLTYPFVFVWSKLNAALGLAKHKPQHIE